MPNTLYLHVGQNKTGTSFIQKALQLNYASLESQNICYPLLPQMRASTNAVGVSSGNGKLLYQKRGYLRPQDTKAESYLYSREHFYVELLQQDNLAHLEAFCKALEIERIKILLFVRNPLDFAVSVHQQKIKAQSQLVDVDTTFQSLKLDKLMEFIQTFSQRKDVELTLVNYSKEKNNVLEKFGVWLGISSEITSWRLPQEPVNRSLTLGEYYIQRGINKYFPKATSSIFAKSLVEKYPSAVSQPIIPTHEVQKAFLQNNQQYIDFINQHLPSGQKYDCSLLEPSVSQEQIGFDPDHLEIIGECLHNVLVMHEKQKKKASLYTRAKRAIYSLRQ